jgi:hypothetical protein
VVGVAASAHSQLLPTHTIAPLVSAGVGAHGGCRQDCFVVEIGERTLVEVCVMRLPLSTLLPLYRSATSMKPSKE